MADQVDVSGGAPGTASAVASTSVMGSYAEYALVPAAQLVKVPEGLSLECAAAAMLQGMTAHYLAYSTYALRPATPRWFMRAPAELDCC